jgi:hypothetical protein
MARGNARRQTGGRRYARHVQTHASELAAARALLEGKQGTDADFADTLERAMAAAALVEGKAPRMTRGGHSRRTACARVVMAQTVRVNNKDNIIMTGHELQAWGDQVGERMTAQYAAAAVGRTTMEVAGVAEPAPRTDTTYDDDHAGWRQQFPYTD